MRFIFLAAFFLCLCLGAAAEPPETKTSSAVLIEAETARILYAKNENERFPMASTTKIMTALLTLENCGMDEIVTASDNAVGVPGTSIYLSKGEKLTVEQLLYAIMLRSGNDAAVALAEHVASDTAAFAAMMNEEARRLGANARFVNPHGLDEKGHEASALGMALIAREAMEYPAFRRLVSTKRYTIPWVGNEYERVLSNKNKLLSNYPNATGVKTGFTKKAGRCLVFSAKKDGMELIGALLNCADWFGEAAKILDWGFGKYRLETAMPMGHTAGRVKVENGIDSFVSAVCPRPLRVPVVEGETCEVEIELEKKLTAPVMTGAVVGTATAVVGGEVVARLPLVVERGTERRAFFDAFLKVLRAFNPAA